MIYTSVQRNIEFTLSHNNWHSVSSYDQINHDSHGSNQSGISDMIIHIDGLYQFFSKLTVCNLPHGDAIRVRLVRDQSSVFDITGTQDLLGSKYDPDYFLHSWMFSIEAGRKVCLQVRNLSSQPVTIKMVQFKMAMISAA